MQNAVAKLMTNLLQFELLNTPLEGTVLQKITPETAVLLYRLGVKHDVGHLIADALDKLSLLDGLEEKREMCNERAKAVFRFEQLNYETQEIVKTLERAQIPYILLKGAVLRKSYPQPWMRTSCDVDILVKKEDFQRATDTIVDALEYTAMPQGGHDISLYSGGGVHLELHYALFDDYRKGETLEILENIWSYAVQVNGNGYEYALTDEAFYFYHIAHMAKHFEEGGCGLRSFVDLYYLDTVWQHDESKRNALLEKGGLMPFATGMRDVTRVWFNGGEHTEFTLLLEEYILRGGVYGTLDNKVTLQQSKQGDNGKYIRSRIWLPYDVIKHESVTLQKHKWLLPFYQVRRWFRMLFQGRLGMRVREAKMLKTTDEAQKQKTRRIITELGLSKK